jgi:hypothetical protein
MQLRKGIGKFCVIELVYQSLNNKFPRCEIKGKSWYFHEWKRNVCVYRLGNSHIRVYRMVNRFFLFSETKTQCFLTRDRAGKCHDFSLISQCRNLIFMLWSTSPMTQSFPTPFLSCILEDYVTGNL